MPRVYIKNSFAVKVHSEDNEEYTYMIYCRHLYVMIGGKMSPISKVLYLSMHVWFLGIFSIVIFRSVMH